MKICFISLGCDKNSVDTEKMMGLLAKNGYTFSYDPQDADGVVINTCCFIGDAKEESINTIIEIGELKKSGKVKALIVTGCLAQRYFEEIKDELPEVDAILGIASTDKLLEALDYALSGNKYSVRDELNSNPLSDGKRVVTTGGYYEYLKIAEGCNKRCTYCVIPYVRGAYRSIPIDTLVDEARELVSNGVKELILVAQETTVYGMDLYGEKSLPRLLKELCRIEDLSWIRILYCYPEEITDELIEVIATEEKVVNYLDIPIQSGSDNILRKMGRKTTVDEITAKIAGLRKKIPDICLRTTLISGFPGESDEDHKNTCEFVKKLRFDRLGVFTYSQEEGTVAADLPMQVDEELKAKRQEEIMLLQQEIAFETTAMLKGKNIKAMVEGYIPEENIYVGRTYRDAPDVDGDVFITSNGTLVSGDIIDVLITGTDEYDLMGEQV